MALKGVAREDGGRPLTLSLGLFLVVPSPLRAAEGSPGTPAAGRTWSFSESSRLCLKAFSLHVSRLFHGEEDWRLKACATVT